MQSTPLTAEQKLKITGYLEGYALNQKMLVLDKYEHEYFDGEPDGDVSKESPLAKAKMYGVRHFILSLPNGDEKLFLYYHYIKEQSVARCSELLGVSERGGYRLKNRALSMAYHSLFMR